MKEKIFVVAKIDKAGDKKPWSEEKAYLYSRLLEHDERRFLTDIVSSGVMSGPKAWDLAVGDVIACVPNGSIEKDIPASLKHVRRFEGMDKTTLNFWLPTKVYPSVKNLIITDECVDGHGLAKDGSLIDTTYLTSSTMPGEEWECAPMEISLDNQIVWCPLKRLSKVKNELVKDEDGKYMFCVREISGNVVLTEAMVDPEIIHTHPKKGVIRMEMFFPIDKYDLIETKSGIIPKEHIPSLAGMLIIEEKINEEEENAITNYNYMDRDHITGFHSVLDVEKVDSAEISRVEA